MNENMKLPEGKTCADCANWSMCDSLTSSIETNTECQLLRYHFLDIGKPACPDCDGSGEVACESWYNSNCKATCGRCEGKGTI
jgi:DnaJ-class molecular chaperone